MKTAPVAFFLLLLFQLVILFPGYGSTCAKSNRIPPVSKAAGILKKCLSGGISNSPGGVTEERSSSSEERAEDEAEGEADCFCGFLVPVSLLLPIKGSVPFSYSEQGSLLCFCGADILSPPPNCI